MHPAALRIGSFAVHWYGLMYLVAFASAWWLGGVRAKRPNSGCREQEIGDLIFYGALGVILGGRIGYVLFYNFEMFLNDPPIILKIWQGGMSFHGGLLGVLIAMWLYGRNTRRSFFQVTDFIAPLVPIGLGAGRIGNFINAELWGRVSDVPWAMQLPCARFAEFCLGRSEGYSAPRQDLIGPAAQRDEVDVHVVDPIQVPIGGELGIENQFLRVLAGPFGNDGQTGKGRQSLLENRTMMWLTVACAAEELQGQQRTHGRPGRDHLRSRKLGLTEDSVPILSRARGITESGAATNAGQTVGGSRQWGQTAIQGGSTAL